MTRYDQSVLIAMSTETNTEKAYLFGELQAEIDRTAAVMQSLDVGRSEHVLIYMPMVAESMFTMRACARIGAIHSVVFGDFVSNSLASHINDTTLALIVSADSRGGKVLLDDAIKLAQHKPAHVLLVNRGLAPMEMLAGHDVDYVEQRQRHIDVKVLVVWLESNEASYVLYTFRTTGKPKDVQRDVAGYQVALATSMDAIFCRKPGSTYFCTSDIGWVVGYSYIVYGPLIAGMATVLYEGLPIWLDGGTWWRIVEKYKVRRMFSAPTAIRVLKKKPPELIKNMICHHCRRCIWRENRWM